MEDLHEASDILTAERIAKLTAAFRASWSKETCYPSLREAWSEERKSLGQCAVTALIVQELYGGTFADDKNLNHIWNVLPDGSEHDFSRMQFISNTELKATMIRNREDLLLHPKAKEVEIIERHTLLRDRVFKVLK